MSYVLVVDDDATMAQAIADMVTLFDWKTQIALGPRPALQAIQAKPPALILLDLNMPGVDGFEVCRFIKRDPIAGKTPVVFVTAEDAPSMQEKAKEAGASDYLIKPIDIDRLEVILDKLPKAKQPDNPPEKSEKPEKSEQSEKSEK
jgi:CheY-like chemotaxis protein